MRASSPIVKGLRKLHTMGIGLMDGREFTSLDEARSASTTIVTHSFGNASGPISRQLVNRSWSVVRRQNR